MAVGTRVGPFTLKRKLARGGMADIFLARHDSGGRQQLAVVKMILPQRLRDSQALKLFLGEARLAAMLKHPNIVGIIGLDRVDDYFYLAMEYVAGETLHAILLQAARRRLGLRPSQSVALMVQACQGLSYAHELCAPDGTPLHIVHRDISLSNIMLGYDGVVRLLDFGVAAARTRRAGFPQGRALGKLAYMAPEQIRGGASDCRSDIYALGVVLWELLTGGALFAALPREQMLQAILEAQVPPPSRYRPGLDPALEQVVLQALRPDPQERFQSAAEFQAALQQTVQPLPQPAELSLTLVELFGEQRRHEVQQGEVGEELDLATLLFDDLEAPEPEPLPLPRPRVRVLSPFTQVFLVVAAVLLAGATVLLWWARPASLSAPRVPPTAPARLQGVLQVDSSPRGARVELDGRDTGMVTPATVRDLPLGRPLRLTLHKPGFQAWSGYIELEQSEPRRISALLQPQP